MGINGQDNGQDNEQQNDSSREQDKRQDENRQQKKGKNNKIKKAASKVATAGLLLLIKILPLLLLISIVHTLFTWIVEIIFSTNTPEAIYEGLGVTDLSELIEIKGDEKEGYYLDYKDGVDAKLDEVTEQLKKSSGVKSIDKELLKKMIKAEVITQYPNLGGNVQNKKEEPVEENEETNSVTNGIEYLTKKYGSTSDGANLTAGDGGYYYGKYLFDSRSSLPSFVDWCYADNPTTYLKFEPFINSSQNLANNAEFIKTWKDIYLADKKGFEADQDEFAYKYFYEPTVTHIKGKYDIDINTKSDALKSVIFSLAVRGGPGSSIDVVLNVLNSSDTDEVMITKLYEQATSFWNGDAERWKKEQEAALKILDGKIKINKNSKKEESQESEETGFQGAIKIRRVTPNKNLGELKNTAAGTITKEETTTVNLESLGTKQKIPESIKSMMKNVSMPNGATVKFDDLSYLTIPYYDFDGKVQQGHMVVNSILADEVLLIFQELYNIQYPIEKMQLIDAYKDGGVNKLDYNSIDDNNTSAFCYRQASTGGSLSNHAYGKAIDINPKINPYVDNGNYSHSNAQKYVNRENKNNWNTVEKQAYIDQHTEVYKIFTKYGWKWGGDWDNPKDYQHFEKTNLDNVATISGNSSGSDVTTSKQYTIAIAAGHNNSDDTGASYEGLVEQDMTIKVAEYVGQLFSPYSNINVVQTGSTSSNPGGVKLNNRLQLAKDANPDLLVVIHFNASESHNANGVETYHKGGDEKSKKLSETLTKTISNAMGLENRGAKVDTEVLGRSLVSIGNSSECGFPCALTEGGFIDGNKDRAILSTEEGLKNYARGIVDGVLEYFDLENKGYGDASITTSGTSGTAINSKIYDLKYVPEKTFNKYVEDNDKKALDVFTLDENKKLITAKWSYTTEEGLKIIKNSPINYLPVLRKYTLPYEYLINWLIDCKDSNFVSSLADLAIDSEFIIAVEDNVTTVQTVVDNQHKDIVRKVSSTQGTYIKSESDWYTVSTDTKIRETVSNTIELTYADTWFVKFQKESNFTDATISTSNNLIADQGGKIGDFKITTYCSACNSPPGSLQTAAGVDATVNNTIAVHQEYFTNSSSPLAKGKQVVINGQVYTVQDTGDLNHRWPDNWIDIFIANENGSCVCNYSSYNSDNTPVYIAEDVREGSKTEASYQNNLINAIANVKGKVSDSTTVTTEYLGEEVVSVNQYTEWDSNGNRRYVYDANVVQKRKITTVRTISNKYDTGEPMVTGNEYKFIKVFKENEEARKRVKPSYLFTIMEKQPKTANMVDLTKYLLYKAMAEDYGKTDYAIEYERYKYNDFNPMGYGSVDISLTDSVLTKEKFVQALQAYYDKTGNISFQQNFLSRAEEIYDLGEKYHINPELIITMALKESGFKSPGGGNQNFWGLDTPNGSSSHFIGSFEEAIKLLAETFDKCKEGSGTFQEKKILERYEEREAANCNSNGYGKPGTLKGMLSVYSHLCGDNTIHREGNAGDGGNYYLKVIYGAEFNAKCGSVHKIGVDHYTVQENADYTAWLYEKQLEYWQAIFGDFGRLGGGSIVDAAVRLHEFLRVNGYYYAQAGISVPNENGRTIDCSSYVTWVLLNTGVEGFTEGMYQWTSYTFEDNPLGWQVVSPAEAQPGDIVTYRNPGHVEIIAANDPGSSGFTVYNCGGNSSIGAAGTEELPESSGSGRSKDSATLILRVPQ